MTSTEIKKALYKEKPTARIHEKHKYHWHYCAHLKNGGVVDFHVPISEMGDLHFGDAEQSQLLIRWLMI